MTRRTRTMLALGVAVAACAPPVLAAPDGVAARATPGAEEKGLREAARDALAARGIEVSAVRVDAEGRRVVLSGWVPTYAEKSEAEETLSRLRGVEEIVNELEVAPARIPDAQLARAVQAALRADPATDEYVVVVDVDHGEATLSGLVDSYQEKLLAGRVAGAVPGVRDVDNELEIRRPAARDDRALVADVRQRLRYDARLDDARVVVKAEQGRVILRGTVDTLFDRGAAIAHAYAAGARNVDAARLDVAALRSAAQQARGALRDLRDDTVGKAIGAALAVHPRMKGEAIDIEVKDGVATLSGAVGNLPAKQAALGTAAAVAGVQRVEDELTVTLVGEVDDAAVKASVDAAIDAERGIAPSEVRSTVKNGSVTLHGVVDSYAERERAVAAASRVPGVVAVADSITARQGGPASDAAIADAIEERIGSAPGVEPGAVDVSVDDGVARLTGEVESWFIKEQLGEDALRAGASRVDNDLQVANDQEETP